MVPTTTPFPTATANPAGVVRVVGPAETYTTIPAALSGITTGAMIRVRAGTYTQTAEIWTSANGLTIEPYGDGPVTIDGQCVRRAFTVHGTSDLTIRGLTIRNTAGSAVWVESYAGARPERFTFEQNTIEDYNCAENTTQASAGVAVSYGGVGYRIVGNTITRRVNLPQTTNHQGNGIWFKSCSAASGCVASGGGHVITDNVITGGYDGIGGETESDSRGSFDRNTVIARNTIIGCRDDGIQVEGGTLNVRVEDNVITDCMVGIALTNNITGPLYISGNLIESSNSGWAGMIACFKVGRTGSGTAYLTGNTCTLGTSPTGVTGDGIKQTNALISPIVAAENSYSVSRYVYEFTGTGPVTVANFSGNCLETSDPARFVKWNDQTFTTLAGMQAATGQESGSTGGPC